MVKVTVEYNGETVVKEGDFVYAVVTKKDEEGVWTEALLNGKLKGIGLGELLARASISNLKEVDMKDGGGALGLVEFAQAVEIERGRGQW